MDSKHMTQKVFAQFTGINEGSLSLLLRDKAQPTLKICEAIYKHFPDISMEWLFDGTGPMYKKDVAASGKAPEASAASSANVAGMTIASVEAASSTAPLFDGSQKLAQVNAAVAKQAEKNTVKYVDKPQRKITEIRVFFDDQTWESFVPKH